MRKSIQLFILTGVLIVSMVSFAAAQNVDIVDNMTVIRIESVEVYPTEERAVHYLNVVAELKNDNDRDLKLTDTDFEFFIQDAEGAVSIGKAACIFNLPDTEKAPITLDPNWLCEGGKQEDIKLDAMKSRRVLFAVEMGRGKLSVLETTIHILNFLGKPQEDRSFLIDGRFDLGFKSDKGWSYGEALRIEWHFCPDIQNELPLHQCVPEE